MSSHARRMAADLEEAHEIATSAASAASRHRYRGSGGSWPTHITDLSDLATAVGTLHSLITRHLAALTKACADDVRTHYLHGDDPDHHTWPPAVGQAAADADQSLSRLTRYLQKTPTGDCQHALTLLHASVQNAHRAHRGQNSK
jgi:hypothetical protein